MHATDNLVLAADNLLQGIALHNGATVDVFTGAAVDLAAGYVVSIDGYGWQDDRYSDTADVVQQYVNHAPEWIEDIGAANPVYVGAWIDGHTGTLHLDLSAVFTGLELALTVAREQRQLAIWDVAAECEIRVDTTDYSADACEEHPDDYRVTLAKRPLVSLRKRGTGRRINLATARLGNGTSLQKASN